MIWNGYGFVVGLVVFACALVAEVVVEWAFADDAYYQSVLWPLALGLAVSGAVLAPIARRLVASRGPARDTFFFVPVRFWPAMLLTVGAAISLYGLVAL